MNAPDMHAKTCSAQAAPPDPNGLPGDLDGMPPDWPAPADEATGEALQDGAEAAPAWYASPGSGLVAQATEQQLAEWMAAIVERDERALAALYDATFSRTFGLVRRIVRQVALAEEVVEDTYFQVWRQAVRFDPLRGSAQTWLLAIARSRAIDALRHEARFRHANLDDGAIEHTPADDEGASDALLDLARHHAELHRALARLGAQPRQIVALAFLRGLTHEEIAQQTCLPLGTVKSQIRRALQSLRQVLGEGGAAALAS